LIAFVAAVSVHEFGHAFVADKLGDRLPRMQGRLTLSPLSHIDPLGTIVLPLAGALSFGRGLEVTLACDEAAFEGSGVVLLGAVLERFFAKYASINSFTETVLRSAQRGEIMRWPTTPGRRQIL
jgi:type VI protein secretion system component VasA